jgi:F-type H+-transporting ATPase subunit b
MLKIVPKEILIQFCLFLVTIFILNLLLFKPLKKLYEARKNKLDGYIKNANNFKIELENKINNYNNEIQKIKTEIEKEEELERKNLELEKDKIIKEARANAQNYLKIADDEIQESLKLAQNQMDSEIIVLSKLIVEKYI